MPDEAIVTTPMVLVATWRDGLFVVPGETRDQELGSQSVRALASDGQGGALAIVNGRSLRRRANAPASSFLGIALSLSVSVSSQTTSQPTAEVWPPPS